MTILRAFRALRNPRESRRPLQVTHMSRRTLGAFVVVAGVAGLPGTVAGQDGALPRYLTDRGAGVPASLFGTYIGRGQLVVHPFFAYSLDNNREYQPAALGFGLDQDFRGKYRSSEALIFVAYGLTDWLALEFEAGFVRATLERSPSDPSAMPARIEESGLGDIEGQLRMHVMREGDHRPGLFGFLEVTPPSQKTKVLIGASEWDFKPGIGIVRGFSWGTMTFRTTVEYNHDNKHLDLGESSLEYLKRLSPSWRVYFGVEGGETGAPDEWDLVLGTHWRIADFLFFKLDNAVGISSKATDWAPQIGMMLSFPK